MLNASPEDLQGMDPIAVEMQQSFAIAFRGRFGGHPSDLELPHMKWIARWMNEDHVMALCKSFAGFANVNEKCVVLVVVDLSKQPELAHILSADFPWSHPLVKQYGGTVIAGAHTMTALTRLNLKYKRNVRFKFSNTI